MLQYAKAVGSSAHEVCLLTCCLSALELNSNATHELVEGFLKIFQYNDWESVKLLSPYLSSF